MDFFDLLMASIISLASYPTVIKDYAKKDMDSGATLVYSKAEVVPDESQKGSKIADSYDLRIYCESINNELIPLKFISTPNYVTKISTLSFSQSEQTTKKYYGSASIDLGLSKNAGAEIDLSGLAKVKEEITISANLNLSFGYRYSNTHIESETFSIYIDGVTNKFGIYAYAYCSSSGSKYYANYVHMNYSNYDQQDIYKTYFLIERVDGHFFLPNSGSTFCNYLYYFETLNEYNDFCSKWSL